MPSNSSHPAPSNGPDLAPLLEASVIEAQERKRELVQERVSRVIEWSQPIPYAVVEWWPVDD